MRCVITPCRLLGIIGKRLPLVGYCYVCLLELDWNYVTVRAPGKETAEEGLALAQNWQLCYVDCR